VKRNATQSDLPVVAAQAQSVRRRHHRKHEYHRACDERKRPIRGLWVRNGHYYAQLTLEDQATGRKRVRRVPMEGATTVAKAREQLEDLKVGRRQGSLTVLKRTPKFEVFADEYLQFYEDAKEAKRASTLETERYAINQWRKHLGHLRVDKIRRVHIDSFIAKRQKAGLAARTVNLEVTVFRNVMRKAIDARWITQLPTENLRPLKSRPQKRRLFTAEEIDRLSAVVFEPVFVNSRLAINGEKGHALLNAQQFADYIRFMRFSGARMSETLRLRWPDVDWGKRQLTIGSDGEVKNNRWRVVDFNAQLEAHLKEMLSRRAPDSEWLFPSPRRGESDRPAKTFREALRLARTAAGLPTFGFHDCRHFFCSMCVMSGIDYMTIAKWVGHRDGGVLIGKVYGHLNDEHTKRAAAKLDFISHANG
jgi:integrase